MELLFLFFLLILKFCLSSPPFSVLPCEVRLIIYSKLDGESLWNLQKAFPLSELSSFEKLVSKYSFLPNNIYPELNLPDILSEEQLQALKDYSKFLPFILIRKPFDYYISKLLYSKPELIVSCPFPELVDALKTANCRIKEIHLYYCKPIWAEDIGKALIGHQSRLKVLELVGAGIGDEETIVLAKGLEASSLIETLNLRQNQIGSIGAQAISYINVISLNLDQNRIGNDGLSSISEVIKKKRSFGRRLACLSVGQNGISDVGLSCLASALSTGNTMISRLNIAGNEIGDVGFIALVKSLKYCKLSHLSVLFNDISDAGLSELAKTIKLDKTVLGYLDISDNHRISNRCIEMVAEAISSEKSCISYLDIIGGTSITKEGAFKLLKAINTTKLYIPFPYIDRFE